MAVVSCLSFEAAVIEPISEDSSKNCWGKEQINRLQVGQAHEAVPMLQRQVNLPEKPNERKQSNSELK